MRKHEVPHETRKVTGVGSPVDAVGVYKRSTAFCCQMQNVYRVGGARHLATFFHNRSSSLKQLP